MCTPVQNSVTKLQNHPSIFTWSETTQDDDQEYNPSGENVKGRKNPETMSGHMRLATDETEKLVRLPITLVEC